jgi:ribonucleoside-triphosphate reductase
MIIVIKKDGTHEPFNFDKIINAVNKSSERVMVKFTEEELSKLKEQVMQKINKLGKDEISILEIHNIVETALDAVSPKVAKSYRDYRNYKTTFVTILDKVYKKRKDLEYLADTDNANRDSALVSTQRSIVYDLLNGELYKQFFLNVEERQAMKDGYIYIHDRSARLDTMNCCLFDMQRVLSGGFEMGNVWYNEPNSLDTAFDVISDITISAAAMQYGGFTIPEVDKLLAPYAKKSFNHYYDECKELLTSAGADCPDLEKRCKEYAYKKVRREMEQGFQGWEYKFNTIGSSRGDYPFIAISFGIGTDEFETMASEVCLEVRKNGQGKKGFKKPVLFPKLTFLYDENLHGSGAKLEWLFDKAIECSSKAMYPDYLSLTGEGYIPEMYKKYGRVVSLMGCRASLSPWYERGGETPADENDKPVFVGRFNLGAISLNLPMIARKAQKENKDFYEVLDHYLEVIRQLHIKTFEFLSHKKASTNPLGYCYGGFLNGNKQPNEELGKDFLRPMTMSFGITALNELEQVWHHKSLVEDGSFSLEVMKHINEKVAEFKKQDHILYAIYGTPAETLCGLQIEQYRAKYGVEKNVSEREYVSNSFHCGVWEDITPYQKQDLEKRFWNFFNGGKIQYVRYPIMYNLKAIKTTVKRAMKYGFYEGVNLSLSYCEQCGYEQLDMDVCPKCGSNLITKIDRMNGYLGYSRVKGKTRYNKAKMAEISERKSM